MHPTLRTPSHCFILACSPAKSRLPQGHPRPRFGTCTCLTLRSLQARGKFQEAATEVRVFLDLMRENQASVQNLAAMWAELLEYASQFLAVLDLEVGEEELIQAVAAALANLRMP